MGEAIGPFKIILAELVASSGADTLGNPARDAVQAEVARLFDVDLDVASSVVSAMPIIVLDGLDGRTAGIVRERLQALARLGCRVVTSDEHSDTIPRVNWPELPPIARVEPEEPTTARPAPGSASASVEVAPAANGAALRCPSCGDAFHLVPANGAPPPSSGPAPGPASRPPAQKAPDDPLRVPLDDDADWLDPPSQQGPVESASRPAAERAPASRPAPAPPPPPPEADKDSDSGVLRVAFTNDDFDPGGGLDDASASADVGGPPEEPSASAAGAALIEDSRSSAGVQFEDFDESDILSESGRLAGMDSAFDEAGGSEDMSASASDILSVPPPHRRDEQESSAQLGKPDFQSDLDLLDDGDGLDDFDDIKIDDESSHQAPPPKARPRAEPARASAGDDPDLEDVLNMFGPEDADPLDDGHGLDPEPLDLTPSDKRERPTSGRAPFDDEVSDILEPLNPDEAARIVKSKRRSGVGDLDELDEPSGLEPLDPSEAFEILSAGNGSKKGKGKKDRKAKRARGAPFSASDEDVSPFEDASPGSGRSKKASGRRKSATDPFARARGRSGAREEPSTPKSSGRRSGGSGKTKKRPSGRRAAASGKRASKRATLAPTYSEGNHGLVLSRISNPDKKEQAAELIAEVKGCSMDDARRLTDRTIIPVLKGVSRELAEHHLARFRDAEISGRVTTRQRA